MSATQRAKGEPKPTPRMLRVKATEPKKEPRAALLAKLTVDGMLPLTFVSHQFARSTDAEELDITAMHERMADTANAAASGDLSGLERMLSGQAQTLNLMFAELAQRAALNMSTHLEAAETYLRLAFKAQSQSRATVEALGELKNPRAVAFVRQANFAQQQQVNNGAPARQTAKPANKQSHLEAPNEWSTLDIGTKATPTRGDSAMETVGAIHRPAN